MTPRPERDARTIRHGTLGRLFATDGASVPVSITHGDDGLLLLILDGPADFTRAPLTQLTLESAGGQGVLRTSGSATHVGPNLLKFVVDQLADVVQRREFVRVTATQKVTLESEDGALMLDTLTLDISGGGMLVKVPKHVELPKGDLYFTLNLGLESHADQEITGTARVVRSRGYNAALSFCSISHANQERLIRFIFERQRVALAVTRGDGI